MAGRDRREDPGQYYPGGRVVTKTPTGQGGGGTSDYDQLANKPKINNHELTGNKTAEQLGLATPSDIPDVTGKLPMRALPPYLHYLAFDDTYPADAAWLYAQLGPSDLGRCSAVRRGGKLWRNYDWTFDFAPEFVVPVSGNATRFASVGVASVGARLTENDVMSAVNSRYYKCLPGMTLDGINEKGVVCEINVDGGPKTGWHGTGANALHILAAVRWALDHGETAQQAAEWLANHIIKPTGEMNFHFMVADAEKTYIVENGAAHDVTDGTKVLTNYALYDSAHAGGGKERYNILAGGADISAVNFTNAYQSGNTWDSDFESAAQHAAAIEQWAAQGTDKEAHRGKTTSSGKAWWQSVHTTEYDFAAKTMKVAVQEVDDWYTFSVDQANVDLSPIEAQLAELQDGKRDLVDFNVYNEVENTDWTFHGKLAGIEGLSVRVTGGPSDSDPWYYTVEKQVEVDVPILYGTATSGPRRTSVEVSLNPELCPGGGTALVTRESATKPGTSVVDSIAKVSQLTGKQDKITASGVLKGNGSGGVSAASSSSTGGSNADYRDPQDNTCHKTELTEWTYELPEGATIDGQLLFNDYWGSSAWWASGTYNGRDVTWVHPSNDTNETDISLFRMGEGEEPTVHATRTAVCTNGEKFTTPSYHDPAKADRSDIIDPALAAAIGKIADAKLTRDFVNTMVSTNSAHYLTARAGTAGSYTYPPFASAAALRAAVAEHTEQNPQFFYAGEAFTPTKNDWVIVSADEDHPLGTITPASRYGFVGEFGSGGSFQYQVSYKLPLTTAQIAALDSGATSTRLSGLESDGTATNNFATDLLGKQVAIQKIDERLPIPISSKSAGFTTEGYKRFVVTVSGAMTVTLHKPTGTDAEVFECRFDGSGLSADASITFAKVAAFGSADAITTMDTNCGTVTKGKVALMSAFWNGATWDVNWKVEG